MNLCVIGAGFSLVEGMLFIALKNLNASDTLCGLSIFCTIFLELPLFYNSSWIIRNVNVK